MVWRRYKPLVWRRKPWLRTYKSFRCRCKPDFARVLTYVARLFADLTRHQQPSLWWRYLSRLQHHQPAVLAHVAQLLAYFSGLWLSHITILFTYLSELLSHVAFVLAHLSKLQPYLACPRRWSWCNLTALQPDVPSVQPDVAYVQPNQSAVRRQQR